MSTSEERDRNASAPHDESGTDQSKQLDSLLEHEMPLLLETYKSLHAAPELSHFEQNTSARIAGELRSLGYAVTERLGKYARPEWTGYGVVGSLENGDGPTVLVRTDMDALPLEEKTGLTYASTVKTKNEAGQDVGVMHACGHDIHMTCMLGTARLLTSLRDRWSGTVLMVGQPAEETIDGAKSMLDTGLYEQFRQPDYALALHNYPQLEVGKIGYTPGYFMASANSVDITIRGIGGHGSMPQQTKDPIVLAAQVVLALQSIVSREVSPLDPAVVSVGSIHGGTRYNIIPDEVHLQLTVRAYKEEVRNKVLNSIGRITRGIAIAAGIDDDRLPVVKVNETEFTPATHNNPDLTSRLTEVFRGAFGAENVVELLPIMGSEDFGRFGLEGHKIPTFMFWVGAVDPLKLAEGNRYGQVLPPLHSNQYAPLPDPTIRAGVKAMTSAVMDLMRAR